MRFNIPAAKDAYTELASILFPDIERGSAETVALNLAHQLAQLAEELGLETRLRDVGVSENQIPMLADDAMKQTRLLVNNPRKMTYEAALEIYQQAH
tara:strand:- start:237 stop:527 length:291 start_codon:yes stop_codon:yes gene_type:complete